METFPVAHTSLVYIYTSLKLVWSGKAHKSLEFTVEKVNFPFGLMSFCGEAQASREALQRERGM